MDMPKRIALSVLIGASHIFGFVMGFNIGSPIENIESIVWVERLPQGYEGIGFDVKCEFVRREN